MFSGKLGAPAGRVAPPGSGLRRAGRGQTRLKESTHTLPPGGLGSEN